MRYRILIVAMLLLSGCTNPYAKFYTRAPYNTQGLAQPFNGDAELYSGSDPDSDIQAMFENGYVLIGYSSFNSKSTSERHLLSQAKKVNAEVVLTYSSYTNTVNASIPFTVQNPQNNKTTYSSGTVYGAGGSASYSGTSTTKESGGQTTYHIPYSVNRYDYAATYWAKGKPLILGINGNELPEAVRQELERNSGVYVDVVVKGSPAFKANLLRGDIITQISDTDVTDMAELTKLLPLHAGQATTFRIIRKGREKTVTVDLGNP